MMNVIEETEVDGKLIIFEYADVPEDPREYTDGWNWKLVMAMNGYDMPNEANIDFDDFDGWEEIEEYLKESKGAKSVHLIYGLSHGQLAISATPFCTADAKWDGGILGLAYITDDSNIIGDELKDLQGELDVYEAYHNGEVYEVLVEGDDGFYEGHGYYWDYDEGKEAYDEIVNEREVEYERTVANA